MTEIANASVQNANKEDESSSSSDDELFEASVRAKRAVQWSPNTAQSSLCKWPPDPSAPQPIWTCLRSKPAGNPNYGHRMQLYSATGWNLAIYNPKVVRGSQDDTDRHCRPPFLELSYAGVPGHVYIQCVENSVFLAMNRKGRLFGEIDNSDDSTIFIESLQGSYNTYLSKKYAHLGWYIGLKKSGKAKRGLKTGYNQKAVKFLPRRSNFN